MNDQNVFNFCAAEITNLPNPIPGSLNEFLQQQFEQQQLYRPAEEISKTVEVSFYSYLNDRLINLLQLTVNLLYSAQYRIRSCAIFWRILTLKREEMMPTMTYLSSLTELSSRCSTGPPTLTLLWRSQQASRASGGLVPVHNLGTPLARNPLQSISASFCLRFFKDRFVCFYCIFHYFN